MPVRLTALPAGRFADVCARIDDGSAGADDRRAATKHLLAVLVDRAPGNSVEVRVPPFAAAQCIAGSQHTRGTPPAVVEADPDTWIALTRGKLDWSTAIASGRVSASGERSDLSAYLPIT